jgi:glutathione S-transferase
VYFGAQLAFSMQFGIMEKRPAFEHYVAGLRARPAAIRANELDDALVAKPSA